MYGFIVGLISVLILISVIVVLVFNAIKQKGYFKDRLDDVVYQVNESNVQHYNINKTQTSDADTAVNTAADAQQTLSKLDAKLDKVKPVFDSVQLPNDIIVKNEYFGRSKEKWITVNEKDKLGHVYMGNVFTGKDASFADIIMSDKRYLTDKSISQIINNKDALLLIGNQSSGDKTVRMVDNVTVEKDLTVKGNSRLKGNLQAQTMTVMTTNNVDILGQDIATREWYNASGKPLFQNIIGKPIVIKSGPGPSGDSGIAVKDVSVETMQNKHFLTITFVDPSISKKYIDISSVVASSITSVSVDNIYLIITFSNGNTQRFAWKDIITTQFPKYTTGPHDTASVGEMRISNKDSSLTQMNFDGKTIFRGTETVVDTSLDVQKNVKLNGGNICINNTCMNEQQLKTLLA
jgi:competence protein ComGC